MSEKVGDGPWKVVDRGEYFRTPYDPRWAIEQVSGKEPFWVALVVNEANAHRLGAAWEMYNALNDIMKCVEAGVLVRDTSRDAEVGWALHQLPILMSLKAAQQALAKARGEA